MSLDVNLFTLLVQPLPDNPNVVDLVEAKSGTAHYRKQRVPGPLYQVEMYDPRSEGLLAQVSAPSSTSKQKTIELYNPTSVVELKYTGTITFRWGFKWEEHEFEWKREECYLIRKPDPAVLVAITKEPSGRLKSTSIQILDYNLNRFDIHDRKGLEVVLLTSLLTFQDSNETHHDRSGSSSAAPSRRKSSGTDVPEADVPPPLPSKPAARVGVDRIAEMQAIRGEVNEVSVAEEGSIEDYATYCHTLLQDDALLFITVCSAEADQVSKVLQVVEETKRLRHKDGLEEEQELHQYVVFEKAQAKKGPKRINLDDTDPKKDKGKAKQTYEPPKSLTIHLSKIAMPELQPKPTSPPNSPIASPGLSAPTPANGKDLEKKKTRKDKDKKEKKKEVKDKDKGKQAASNASSGGKFSRPAKSKSPSPPRVHSHQTHPYQVSPSPAQLNNPFIYTAPPPPPPPPRPTSSTPHYFTAALPKLHVPGTTFWTSSHGQSGNPVSPGAVVSGMMDKLQTQLRR